MLNIDTSLAYAYTTREAVIPIPPEREREMPRKENAYFLLLNFYFLICKKPLELSLPYVSFRPGNTLRYETQHTTTIGVGIVYEYHRCSFTGTMQGQLFC